MSFRNGGWVVLLALCVFVAAGVWQTIQVLDARGEPRAGDGEHVETYGFDLSTLLVPRSLLAATSLPRDGIERLDFPPLMDVDVWSASWSDGRHRKYLVPSDRVVGVSVNGHTRAYPLRVLVWREVVNDTLGGVPIAVTYAPLADAAMVLDRRSLAATGARAPILLGFSGLVYNGCPLVYGVGDGSLYSPLGLCSVAGPAAEAGVVPEPLPAGVVTWGDWIAEHPATRVVEPTLESNDRYRTDPYHNYYGNDLLEDHPVEPRLPEGARNKARVLALLGAPTTRVVYFEELARRAGDSGICTIGVGGARAKIAHRENPHAAWVVTSDTADVVGVSCFAWAWYALHPASMRDLLPG